MTTINCPLCIESHLLRWCPKFRQMSPEIRLRTTLIYRYCSNCLASNHSKAECDSVIRCKHCGSPHHTMLHGISSDAEELDEDVVDLTWAQQVELEASEMEEETIATADSIPSQPCQPTSSVMQPRESSDQRCLSRIPHAQDRARLDSSRRLRRAGNFYSDWRHDNDRLRLDSSQRHYPDPRPKIRCLRGARRQADARRIIKDRHATLPWQQKIALSPTALIKIRTATRFITVRAMTLGYVISGVV
ncbi:uncharacterized protein LOC128922741 [Zeugodacus cucurbitae]|uniref:uncharacterized protein LOC128922741 n=1 Tax=Zeugodacus cucurbitae TaxID=28588 RepID=UPI0023D8F362|nr:uncharacterized protein LOC128922741 [Zeugodacus cucurbitae]